MVEGLEIELIQLNRREASTRDDVGNIRAQIGIDNVRAVDAKDGLDLIFRNVAYLKNAGLLALDEKENLILDLRGNGDSYRCLINVIGELLVSNVDL